MKKRRSDARRAREAPAKGLAVAKRAPSRPIYDSSTGEWVIGVDQTALLARAPCIWVRSRATGRALAIGVPGSIRLVGDVRLIWDVPIDGRPASVRVELDGEIYYVDESDDDETQNA